MCGIAAIAGRNWEPSQLDAMVAAQAHRGPDATGNYINSERTVGLGHNRLSIIDLSPAGRQPMCSPDRRYWLVFNGEIYNYLELRAELSDYPYRSHSDSEVILAAYEKWGTRCVEHFIGMFAFVLWDEVNHQIFAARDRFGVKPLYYSDHLSGTIVIGSEIKTVQAATGQFEPDAVTWSTYLTTGMYDHRSSTFWNGIQALPAGHSMQCQVTSDGVTSTRITCWYDLAQQNQGDFDSRPLEEVCEEYLALLENSLRLRFRADVPVGVCLSGGLDSSILLGLIQHIQGHDSDVQAFTFITGDRQYDELPWVEHMLARTKHPFVPCLLKASEIPELAVSVQRHQDEPFGGLPTLAYSKVFEEARARGVIVLLDGQGMDEQWAGYDYYVGALAGSQSKNAPATQAVVQGSLQRATRPECLTDGFRALATAFEFPQPFSDRLRNLQYRDARYSKIPRALRFNDRISMRSSTELREPFLDHRLFELAFRQPPERKIGRIASGQTVGKWGLRHLTKHLLPTDLVEAPKRPVQTPQREWLRGCLNDWATDCVEAAIQSFGETWLVADTLRSEWLAYQRGESDNSFYVWQWISLGLMAIESRSPSSDTLVGSTSQIPSTVS